MKKNTYHALTDEELQKKQILIKVVLIAFSAIYVLMYIVLIFLYSSDLLKSNSFIPFLPLFIAPVTLIPIFINLGMIKKEVKSRKL